MFGRPIARSLSDTLESAEDALDTMADSHGRMPVAAGEFGSSDALDLELG